jgi:hypothetical protein
MAEDERENSAKSSSCFLQKHSKGEWSVLMVLRVDVVEALLKDPVWRRRLAECKTPREVEEVLEAFARAKGFRVVEVKP